MTPAPYRSLRAWLQHLAETDRLAIAREGRALHFELAAIATLFSGELAKIRLPSPG